jgi:hypothetical protein
VELELLVNKQQTRGSWAERAAEAAAPAKTTGRAPCSQHSGHSAAQPLRGRCISIPILCLVNERCTPGRAAIPSQRSARGSPMVGTGKGRTGGMPYCK